MFRERKRQGQFSAGEENHCQTEFQINKSLICFQVLFAEGAVNGRIETLCLREQHDKSWTGPYVCCHTGFLGHVLTIRLTAAPYLRLFVLCVCVYFAPLLFPFPQGYQDRELHSWQIFPTCVGQLCIIYMFFAFFKCIQGDLHVA